MILNSKNSMRSKNKNGTPIKSKTKQRTNILSSLDEKNTIKMLTYLKLSQITILLKSVTRHPKTFQLQLYINQYLITNDRAYTLWQQKQFLNFMLEQVRYQINPGVEIKNESRVSTKSQFSNCCSIESSQSRGIRRAQTLIYDIERTNLKFSSNHLILGNQSIKKNQKIVNYSKLEGVEHMHVFLSRVLTRISKKFQRLGYIQGFNCICKNLYLTGFSQEEAYEYLNFLIEDRKLGEMFAHGMQGIKQLCYVLKVYIYNYIPAVYEHFEETDVETQIFAVNWFITLFSEDLPPFYVNRLWHLFVIQGWKVFIQFAIALLCIYQKQIILQSYDQIFTFLRRIVGYFRQDFVRRPVMSCNVWKLMSSVEINDWVIQKLRKQMKYINGDTKIELWKLKNYRRKSTSDCSIAKQKHDFPQNIPKKQKIMIGSNWCCDKPVSSNFIKTPYFFPFCKNLTTTTTIN